MELSPELADWIESQMIGGQSQAEIARALFVDPGDLSRTLSATDERAQRFARARAASAEAWLDRGLTVIGSSLQRNGPIDPTAARAYAQECARRAAIRNPQYRDKQDHTLTGPDGGPIEHKTYSRVEFVVVDPKAPAPDATGD